MTALPAELLERARRHGLTCDDRGRWLNADGIGVHYLRNDGSWQWSLASGRRSLANGRLVYRKEDPGAEAAALQAALAWFDTQHPDKAWKPEPWAPIVEALRLLRPVLREFMPEAVTASERLDAQGMAVNLGQAIADLERAALGPNMASAPEQALSLLLDLAGDRGGELGEGLREQLRRVLQARPDEAVQLVSSLEIAGPWKDGQRVSVGHASEIDQLRLWAWVREVTGGWRAVVDGETIGDGEEPILFASEQAAQAAVDEELLERGLPLAGGPVVLCTECQGEGVFGGCTTCGEEAELVEGEGDDEEPVDCPECDGEGAVHDCGEDVCPCDDLSQDLVECIMCGGSGQVIP